MPRFLTPLRVEQLGEDRWKLLAPLVYVSASAEATIEVPAGFITDFESIPRWLPIAYAALYGGAHAAGVIHDDLYQTQKVGRCPISRAQADAVLYEATGATGPGIQPLSGWKRWAIWSGVRIGGRGAWRSGPYRLQILWDRRRTPRPDPAEEGI